MLARLDELPGVAESRVDWTGQRFLLALEPGASERAVERAAADALGEGAEVLSDDDERAARAGRRSGEAWMRAGETLDLSRHEAGVLAERHGAEAARVAGLSEDQQRKLVALLDEELVRAFERVHAVGPDVLRSELLAAASRSLAASRAFLDDEQEARLAEHLASLTDG